MIVLVVVFVITIEIEASETIRKIVFKRSNFSVHVERQHNDARYLAKVYNGIEFNCKSNIISLLN